MSNDQESTGPVPSPADQDWLARLADPRAVVADQQAAREADALSGAIRREAEQVSKRVESAFPAEVRQRRLDDLLAAMRSEGLFSTATAADQRSAPETSPVARSGIVSALVAALAGPWRWAAPAAIAASVLLAVVLVRPWSDDGVYGAPPQWRGDAPAVVVVVDASPRSRAETLAKAFEAAGLTARLYRRDAVFFVDVDVPPEAVEPGKSLLESLEIEPKTGQYRVEIRPPK
ncbi:MAG: hypothetical protein H6934_13795 [Burkholderiaceae bacterium]|nr:hypothetical protein [Burkholderiaceae bacterium]